MNEEAPLAPNEEDFNYILPMVQKKITGQDAPYVYFAPSDLLSVICSLSPCPISHQLSGLVFSYKKYDYLVKNKSNNILSYLAELGDDEFQRFIFSMKARLNKQSSIAAMSLHMWNDEFALQASNDNPLYPVFVPNQVINCKGIGRICNNREIKRDFIEQVNNHISLSPHERSVFLESYSEVRKITKQDCKKDGLPNIMIGQKGVFSKYDLPEFFFLGVYSGTYFDDKQNAKDHLDALGIGAEIYLFGHENQDTPIVSAYRAGNRISLINSATDYSGDAATVAKRLFYNQNTLPMSLKIDNNPNELIKNDPTAFDMSGYVTIRPIKAGEQIYVDYGYNYWMNKSSDFTDASSSDIDDEYLKLKNQ